MKKQLLLSIFVIGYIILMVTNLIASGLLGSVIGKFSVIVAAVLAYVTIVFVIAQMVRRYDIVDIAWGGGFIVAALTSFLLHPGGIQFGWNVQTIATTLVLIWGLRLGYYILRRVMRSTGEDPRYLDMRKQCKGSVAINAYLRIFITQGLLAIIISISFIHINLSTESTVSWLTYIGVLIWLVGFIFEAVGDAQLKKHLGNLENRGTIMTQGLWRFTRHPNYFGEATQWWGIFIICLGVPYGIDGIIGPVVITYLLLFVSGVPLTEKRFEGRPGWDDYRRQTSMFVPMLPKKV